MISAQNTGQREYVEQLRLPSSSYQDSIDSSFHLSKIRTNSLSAQPDNSVLDLLLVTDRFSTLHSASASEVIQDSNSILSVAGNLGKAYLPQ